MEIEKSSNKLIGELVALIEEGKKQLAYAATATTALTYCRVGKRINTDCACQYKRADYDEHIVVSVARQLSWTHFIALIPLKDPLQRDFMRKCAG
jgi:hypothetical protein